MQRIRTRRAPLGLQRFTKAAKSPPGLRLRQQKQTCVCGLTSQSRPNSGHFAFFQSLKCPKWSNRIMVRFKRISLCESGDPLANPEQASAWVNRFLVSTQQPLSALLHNRKTMIRERFPDSLLLPSAQTSARPQPL
jgi:hypothetical protein